MPLMTKSISCSGKWSHILISVASVNSVKIYYCKRMGVHRNWFIGGLILSYQWCFVLGFFSGSKFGIMCPRPCKRQRTMSKCNDSYVIMADGTIRVNIKYSGLLEYKISWIVVMQSLNCHVYWDTLYIIFIQQY